METGGQEGELSHTHSMLQEELSITGPDRTVKRKASSVIGPQRKGGMFISCKKLAPQQLS